MERIFAVGFTVDEFLEHQIVYSSTNLEDVIDFIQSTYTRLRDGVLKDKAFNSTLKDEGDYYSLIINVNPDTKDSWTFRMLVIVQTSDKEKAFNCVESTINELIGSGDFL